MLETVISPSSVFDVNADAIVNPANRQPSLWFGSHINERIRKEAGKQVAVERKKKGTIRLGEAVVTSGGNLPFKYIVHAAVLSLYDFNPLFLLRLKQRTSDRVLQEATRNSLSLAAELPVESLVFSPMGAGIGAMPMEKCARIMLTEIMQFSQSGNEGRLRRVIIATRTSKACAVFEQVLSLMVEFNP